MTDDTTPPPEFSRPIDLSRIGEAETVHDISATSEERAALARRFGLLGLDRLDAQVRLRRAQRGAVLHLAGHLSADVTQECVVTLDPVPNHVEEDFVVVYGELPEDDAPIDADDESAVEPLPEGQLDIGEAVAQELSLALDPYPHAPGAAIESPGAGDPGPAERVNPFLALAKLRETKP